MRPSRASAKVILSPYYLRRPWLWSPSIHALDRRTMVNLSGGWLYIRVPKAANSTVVRALAAEDDAAVDVRRLKNAAKRLSQVAPPDLRRVRGLFVFTVVRNPFTRVLSAYLDKMGRAQDGGHAGLHAEKYARAVAGFDDGRLSFRGFCRWLAAGGERTNAHWMRQSRLLRLVDRVDHVGRVETLADDLDSLRVRLGLPSASSTVRDGPPPTRATEHLERYYCKEAEDIVRRVYSEDFERLGYDADHLPTAHLPPPSR